MKERSLSLLVLVLSVTIQVTSSTYKLVGYWGQNGGQSEKALKDYCEDSAFDIIVIGFVDRFTNEKNKDSFPSINLSKHCAYASNTDYPALFICHKEPKALSVTSAIKKCQENGKKVYISLGGATEEYGLENVEQARTFASRMWHLFFGGKDPSYTKLRPFGDAILDGIDLDIEHVKYTQYDGYAEFTKTLHSLMYRDTTKTYYVSGAPQCPFPDQNMKGALENAGHLFDEIFIQYYNNPHCSPGAPGFEANFETWIKFAASKNINMKVYVGLPAHQKASGKDSYYKQPKEVEQIFNNITSKHPKSVGGIMLWDAGYDTKNQIYGHPYSKHLKDILKTGVYNPIIPTAPPKTSEKHKVVAYWGQNGGGSEKELEEYCTNSVYKIIVLGFVTDFFSEDNKWEYPEINFSKHCAFTENKAFPKIPQCAALLGNAIKKCQYNGKRVYISLGGATKDYGIPNEEKAKTLATRIWNLFLGGTLDGHLRPFGAAIKLDGVDMDIEHVKYPYDKIGYPLFLKTLHSYFKEDTSKQYYISGAPQCPYPDLNMKELLSETGHLFDELYIQYYNNPACAPRAIGFADNLKNWIDFVRDTKKKNPASQLKKVLIGLPAGKKASGKDEYFIEPKRVVPIFNVARVYEEFGGFMIWDAGFDEINRIHQKRYSYHLDDIMKKGRYEPVIPTEPPKRHMKQQVVGYWGQNSDGEELELIKYCQNSAYDTIVLGYLHKFFDKDNKNSYPGINFSKWCGTKQTGYESLLLCIEWLTTPILQCQNYGKKVLLGIGGPYTSYEGLSSDQNAITFANRVWNLFLGGTADSNLRPFGSSVKLDGIVLEIENQKVSHDGFPKFVETLHALMGMDLSKAYFINAAPPCSRPSQSGFMDKMLKEKGHLFDELYIKYYNQDCYPASTSFESNFYEWVSFVRSTNTANAKSNLKKILVALPAAPRATKDAKYYQAPQDIVTINNLIGTIPEFGGIMLHDAGWDESNQIVKQRYSNHVKNILRTGIYDPKEPTPPPVHISEQKVVGYWGQNGGKIERPLMEYCTKSVYEIIIIGFMHVFFDNRNTNKFPSINLSKHCSRSINSKYPGILNCPSIGDAIKKCQSNGKRVFISMGGATTDYGIPDGASADYLAKRVWNLFLGGQDIKSLRPFGSAILDGVDLDIEHVTFEYDAIGYPRFMNKLNEYISTDTSRRYYITGAPQCVYPDKNMKTMLTDTAHLFDEIYIQYYNNPPCSPGYGGFQANFRTWVHHLRDIKAKHPNSKWKKILVGLPTHSNAASTAHQGYYKNQNALNQIYQMVSSYPEFGGFMLWDLGWDEANTEINNQKYSVAVLNTILSRGGPPIVGLKTLPPDTPSPTTPTPLPTPPPCTLPQQRSLVAYWGQDGGHKELELMQYCLRSDYDTIVIGFVDNFFDDRNHQRYPRINLSKHCLLSEDVNYPNLFRCKDIELAIEACHKNNKKVLVSLGGPSKDYGIESDEDAKLLATRIWNLFLGGKDETKLRPFGAAILDGINLHVTQHKYPHNGYPAFVQALHTLMKSDQSRKYKLTAQSTCEHIDKNIRETLAIEGTRFDEIYIKYFDMFCSPGKDEFNTNLRLWKDYVARINTRKTDGTCLRIFIGIPADVSAAADPKFYKIPARVQSDVFTFDIRKYAELGGFMIWDAGFDELNKIKNKRFSSYIKVMLKKHDPKPTTPAITTLAPTTKPFIKDKFEIAAFWGSNKAHKVRAERGILEYCNRPTYDVIIMNTLEVFFDDANAGNKLLPGLNFARHCTGTFGYEKYPKYLNCPGIANQIRQCQKKGKKILLSIGGGSRWVGFRDGERARLFATNLWNLFLGGKAPLRTFGSTVLDGINMDIRHGTSSWWPEFIEKLRELMDTDPSKKYLITANPLCGWPHHSLGSTFATHSKYFDNLYVNFDDKGCPVKDEQALVYALKKWLSLEGPKLFLGIPSHVSAAVNPSSYLSRTEVKVFIRKYISAHDNIKGIVLDETSWDDLNIVNGERYSDFIGEIIKPNAYARAASTACTTNCGKKTVKKGAGNALAPDIVITCLLTLTYLFIIIRLY